MAIFTRFGSISKLVSKLMARAVRQAKSAPNQLRYLGVLSGHGVHSHKRLETDPAKNN
jgi:hypothetical protein